MGSLAWIGSGSKLLQQKEPLSEGLHIGKLSVSLIFMFIGKLILSLIYMCNWKFLGYFCSMLTWLCSMRKKKIRKSGQVFVELFYACVNMKRKLNASPRTTSASVTNHKVAVERTSSLEWLSIQ